jgi:hypothetical protein
MTVPVQIPKPHKRWGDRVTAGSAVLATAFVGLSAFDGDEGFPCADFALLVPLKRSPGYRQVRHRLVGVKPIDAWQTDDLHYFVFQLRSESEAPESAAVAPLALFTMRPGEASPVRVQLVMLTAGGELERVVDLRTP